MAQRESPLGIGQGSLQLGRPYDLPGAAHKPVGVKAHHSPEAQSVTLRWHRPRQGVYGTGSSMNR